MELSTNTLKELDDSDSFKTQFKKWQLDRNQKTFHLGYAKRIYLMSDSYSFLKSFLTFLFNLTFHATLLFTAVR